MNGKQLNLPRVVFEQYQNPKGTYGTSNPGVMTINEMFGQVGIPSFEYCVAPVDGRAGKAAQLKTLHTAIVANGIDYNAAFGGLILILLLVLYLLVRLKQICLIR